VNRRLVLSSPGLITVALVVVAAAVIDVVIAAAAVAAVAVMAAMVSTVMIAAAMIRRTWLVVWWRMVGVDSWAIRGEWYSAKIVPKDIVLGFAPVAVVHK